MVVKALSDADTIDADLYRAIVSDDNKASWGIPRKLSGRTMTSLAYAHELIGLFSEADTFNTTPTVRLQ